MEQQLTEGTTAFFTDSEERITKEMPVFYNPVMKRNRDLTLAVLLAMEQERTETASSPDASPASSKARADPELSAATHDADADSRAPGHEPQASGRRQDESTAAEKQRGLRVGLPMEASGVRAARILHELIAPGHLKPDLIAINDLSEHAIAFAKRNIAHNSAQDSTTNVAFSVQEANIFLRQSTGFDYIDIDPFGTPNPFLDAAVQRISREGILAVTATDTSALAGTYPAATARKYWATPSRTWLMHEAGLRILARKVQLVAAQYDTALVPVLSVATDHYYRIFFRRLRSHAAAKEVVKQHRFLHVCTQCMQLALSGANTGACAACGASISAAGPLWTGPLHDPQFVAAARSQLSKLDEKTAKQLDALLAIIEDEARLADVVGFLDIHELASRLKVQAPRTEIVLERLGSHGARTHIVGHGIKTDLPVEKIRELLTNDTL